MTGQDIGTVYKAQNSTQGKKIRIDRPHSLMLLAGGDQQYELLKLHCFYY
jgi:hypothetical protein